MGWGYGFGDARVGDVFMKTFDDHYSHNCHHQVTTPHNASPNHRTNSPIHTTPNLPTTPHHSDPPPPIHSEHGTPFRGDVSSRQSRDLHPDGFHPPRHLQRLPRVSKPHQHLTHLSRLPRARGNLWNGLCFVFTRAHTKLYTNKHTNT